MSVRQQTLEEWFTDYQLRAIAKRQFHLPIDVEVDVTRLVDRYSGRRPPMTALVIKAAAMLAARHPAANRAVLRTPVGTRVVQFEHGHVNMPVLMGHDGKEFLSAVVIRHADRLSIGDIEGEIQRARQRPIEDLPILRLLASERATFVAKTSLRFRHALAYSMPRLYERHGGGISVSSLVRSAPANVTVRMPSYGPTAFTICPGSLRSDAGKSVLFVGIGYDHVALTGREAVRLADVFGSYLAEGDPALFGPS
ncbi:MAG TPA: hypothetical protein VM925_19835 [Labilithrix sp.]|nr:hypothetical protein [Labilithrix sp.]